MAITLQLRHDTAANWTANNPTLAAAEAGVETDTNKVKLGDGATAWTALPYFTGGVFISSPTWGATMTLTTLGYSEIRVVLAGATTVNLSAGYDGQKLLLTLVQDATGNRIVTWGTGIEWGVDVPAPTLTVVPNMTDYLGIFYSSSAAKWRGVSYARGYV